MTEELTGNEIVIVGTEELGGVEGGWGLRDVNWRKVGEYTAPLMLGNPVTMPIGIMNLNKGAAAQAAVWGAGGAIAGAAGGPKGAALGAAGGAVAGYYGSLI